MSRIRLYIDEDAMNGNFIGALRSRGFDTKTAAEARMVQRLDIEHLRFATNEGRTVYTFNTRDFCRLHAEWMESQTLHRGIVVAPQTRYSVGEQLRKMLLLAEALSAEEMTNPIEFLQTWG